MSDTLDRLRRGELAGAASLTLRCGLTEFPREILGLADTLEVLDLSGNALTTLPDDLGRLHRLRVLFCSGNRFERLPPALGDCATLSQVGFRATGLRELPAESLPPRLRWLTVTDNRIERLPSSLGERPALQKLMLSGNRLQALPGSLAGAASLELLRLSANRFEALPSWLQTLPALAWLAWAGNPLDRAPVPDDAAAGIDWSALRLEAPVGEGASGRVYKALWQPGGDLPARTVALKLFKDAMTSDGLPEREIAASLAAGGIAGLTGGLGRLTGHPDGTRGLLMTLLPDHWRALAGAPSLESCSRDVWEPAVRFTSAVATGLAHDVGLAAAALHARGLLHGDLYAHNVLWDGGDGQSVLSDLGGASFLPPGQDGAALCRIEVRAWGLLLGELLEHAEGEPPASLLGLQQACVQPDAAARPLMTDALAALRGFSAAG